MGKHWRNLVAYCLEKDTNCKGLHTTRFQLYDILKKTKQRRQWSIHLCPRLGEVEQKDQAEHKAVLEKEKKVLLGYYKGEYTHNVSVKTSGTK